MVGCLRCQRDGGDEALSLAILRSSAEFLSSLHLYYSPPDVTYTRSPPAGPGPLEGPLWAPLWEPSETQCTRPQGWAKSSTQIFFRQLFELLLGYTSEYIVYREKRGIK